MDDAITQLEAEITALGKSEVGSTLWYLRQAKSLGLSMLRKARLQGITGVRELDAFRSSVRKELNAGLEQEPVSANSPLVEAPAQL